MVISKDRKVKDIVNILEKLYPKTPIPLKHKDPFTLLVSVVLSAQCTDERVNKVTDVVSEGDIVKVKFVGFDRGKVKLSMKNIDQETGEESVSENKKEDKKANKKEDKKENKKEDKKENSDIEKEDS